MKMKRRLDFSPLATEDPDNFGEPRRSSLNLGGKVYQIIEVDPNLPSLQKSSDERTKLAGKRTEMANKRTYLSYIRTGLTIAAVIDKYDDENIKWVAYLGLFFLLLNLFDYWEGSTKQITSPYETILQYYPLLYCIITFIVFLIVI